MRVALLAACAAAAVFPSAVRAGSWLPHPADATWTYQWSDTVYAPTPTTEKVTVKDVKGATFVLAWTTVGLGNPDGAVGSVGTMTFQETNNGVAATDWSSTPPPSTFPVLCAQATSCANALTETLYDVVWGSRAPVLAEPLQKGLTWASSGGAAGDVTGGSTYLGLEQVSVPAFSAPVTAAKVQTQIVQAGALGDPYGSGQRTVWWVYGVGPVKVEFKHAGGSSASVTTSVLQSTNQVPQPPPDDAVYFPLAKGTTATYRWTNKKHLPAPEVEKVAVDASVNGTARFTVAHVSGPIKVAGSYGFSFRLDGLTNLWRTTRAATTAKLPPLGPAGVAPAKRTHFFTPLDLLSYGMSPLLPAYPQAGQSWTVSRDSLTYAVYGVSGQSRVAGFQTVRVPAGTFRALVVSSTLKQPGFPFGSGTRTCWFAPGKGLVKLVFSHGDGSTSVVELLK